MAEAVTPITQPDPRLARFQALNAALANQRNEALNLAAALQVDIQTLRAQVEALAKQLEELKPKAEATAQS